MALGASAYDVLSLILRQTLRPVVAGALIASRGRGRLQILKSVLFARQRLDPIAFLRRAPCSCSWVAAVASLLPTRESAQDRSGGRSSGTS
jgi:hypothetical protein